MSCVEKRHVGHRTGSMLHHRFPNGFTDLFMDETDREVSILTDRAFRSLCVGDDAVYNDEFLYGYSPFSCHKPLVGDPHKKTHRKDSKKQGQNKNDKNHAQPWQQQQQKKISHMSSFLKALSATEQSCEGMLIKNGGMPDSNGESWDKSALRSIQRELSEFSSGYHTNLTDGHYNNHRRHSSNKTGKDGALPSGKSSKIKNGKSTVKLRKLNIKNFFLHSEFSPFQTWRDFNRFPFSQEETVTSILPTDNIPKWYDLPFYKELTEAHRKETLHTEETQSCQKVEPPPPTAPKPMPPPPPPKLLPKPSATPAEKKSSSDGGEAVAAPWRRNRSRTTSAVPVNQPGIQSQENYSKIVEESLLSVKKEARSVEVKAIEEVSSLASTPFSICQLMTPLIPSRQPTETSEILQGVLSPSALDFPLRPLSETKVTPEPPVKRDSYKSLASSILFNLKDNRKRVKSRYSPPNFKTLELPECDIHSPQSDHFKDSQAGSESNASGLSTPAIFKDALTVCSPNQDSVDTPVAAFTKQDTGTPLSDDYLLSNLLQTKREAAGGEDTLISPFINSKKNKSPLAKRQNYPSLNLYKKASPVDSDMKYLQVPLSNGGPVHVDRPTETNELSPLTLNKDISPKPRPTNTGLSPRTLTSNKDGSPLTSLHAIENERLSSNIFVGERHSNLSDKAKRPGKSTKENVSGVQSASKQKDSGQTMSTMDVIRAAREAINAAKSKALSDAQSESRENPILRIEEINDKETAEVTKSMETFNSKRETESTPVAKTCAVKKEPPPVPKRNFAKADIEFSLDKQQIYNPDESTNVESRDAKLDLENESVSKEGKSKRIFSARQNHYIKHQRYAVTDDEPREECEEGNLKVNMRTEVGEETMSVREIKDNDNIVNDLPALKELERTSFGDRTLENAMNKLGVINIDEEARANTDLISRELRSIKKGMMSMRGNTSAKRELFTKIEKEQSKQDVFTKLDGNVRVNKALINDNYDKAKMALEEIISEREKRRNTVTEQDTNPALDENAGDQSYATRAQQCKQAIMEGNEKHNGVTSAIKQRELKERLGDLRDHNQMRQILSQTEPRLGEPHRIGGRTALPGMDKLRNKQTTAKHVDDTLNDNCGQESAAFNFRHEAFKDSGGNLINETESKTFDAPPVPPRSKKGGNITDGSATKEVDETAGGLFNKDGKYENSEVHLNAMRSTGKQEADIQLQRTETTSDREKRDVADNAHFRGDENAINNLNKNAICISDIPCENSKAMVQETCKIKRKAPLRPDNLVKTDENITKNLVTEAETDNINGPTQEINVETEPRNIMSPLLLVNGVNVPQSPPDQASLSSKSSYFSAESALHRNTETESNVYHSLENLVVEVEQADEECNVSRNMKKDLDKNEVDYYSLSDHEFELEVGKRPITSPEKEKEVPSNDSEERENTTAGKSGAAGENNQTTLSPANTFSPTLGIPALFKVKDNTFSAKLKKTVQPWSPRGSLSGSERGEEELQPRKEVLPPATETISNSGTLIAAEIFKPKEILSKHTPPLLLSPLNVQNQSENLKKPQVGQFLTLPQEDDRFSGMSPSSEGVESLTTSTADTADEMGMKAGVPAEREPSNVPSEHSGSNCSGNEHQMVLPKPPAVLPKSEKAVLKAIKLTNRRIKKEEAQKSPHKSSQSSSKHRTDRHKGEKSEQKGSSSSRSSKSREEKQGGHHQSENHPSNELLIHESRGRTGENHLHERAEKNHNSRRQSRDSEDGKNQTEEAPPSVATERQGRSGERQTRNRSHKRHYSTDRVISTVPVYKAHVGERPLQRSQSIDRCLGERVERRLSADTSAGDKSHPRTQRIEKSIMDELQQRGRARDKASRDNPLRRSHSIDAPHPSTLSRQSSHTSQLSRQSSLEHTIVTQSFPMTQRKLLQDPDSGQYFFVDMPVQVKTKTFFDPETGSYVQLPVKPPEGAIPQASPIDVLTPPLVVYHGFVPVPLSPMAQKATVQASHMEPEEFEKRCLERSRQMQNKEGHPYLEPVYGQHDQMIGEFIGTEELDCPS